MAPGGNIISNYKADFPDPQMRPRPDGIAREIQRTLKPEVFDKVADGGPHNPALVKAGVKSYAGVPVIGEGRLRAIIFFHSRKPAAYRGKLPLLLTLANQVATAMRNCELFEQEQAKRLLAERLQAASSIVRSSLDWKEVLGRILTEVAAVVPYGTASIQLLQGNQLKIVACRGFPEPEKVLGLTFPMDIKFPNYHVVRRKEWFIVDDVRTSYPHFAEPRWHATHIRSWLGIPLIYRGDVIGMLSLDHKKPAFYQPSHAETAWAFTAQATAAIKTAQLFEEVHDRLNKAEVLASVTSELLAETDTEQLQHKVPAWAARLLWNADGAVLHLLNGVTQELQPAATWPQSMLSAIGQSLMTLGEGIAGTALQERKTVRLDDVSSDSRFQGPSRTPELKSLLVAPLYVGVKLLGTLSVYSRETAAFSENDEHLLTTLASQAGTALANLEMWQARDVKRQRVEQMLERLREFDVDLGLDEVQHRIVAAATDILGYRLAALKMLNPQGGRFTVKAVIAPEDLRGVFDPTNSAISMSEMDGMLKQGQAMKHCRGFWVPGALLRCMGPQPAASDVEYLAAEQCLGGWTPDDALLIPLDTAEESPIGFLALALPESGSLPQYDDQQLIGVFASLATTIIQNARLFQATKNQKERLHAYLSAAGSQLAHHTDMKGLGTFIVQAGASFLDAADCSLFLVDEDGQTIRYVTSSLPRSREESPSPMPVSKRKGAGLVPYVAATGRPLTFIGDQFTQHDAHSDHPDAQVPWSRSGHSNSLLLVPMYSGDGSIVGVLTVENKQGVDPDEGFSSFDMEFLQALASQAAADVVRLREFRRLSEEASRVERSRLEGELHEAMNILATGAMWEADVLAEYTHTLPEEATYGLQRLRQAMRRAYEDLKYILWDLRDPVLEEQGLVVALEAYAGIIGRGLVTVIGDREHRIQFEYEHALYRIGQEAISNAMKHSCIKCPEDGDIRVSVEFGPSSVRLSVSDDGIGFDMESAFQRMVIPSGLVRLRELARSVGIEFEVRSERGKGTEVCAQVQLAATGE